MLSKRHRNNCLEMQLDCKSKSEESISTSSGCSFKERRWGSSFKLGSVRVTYQFIHMWSLLRKLICIQKEGLCN